eukprot:Phypoly_transcript_09790.p1 GENE.Phypoly_transcript_09790~~Phypoly_transcript_09790.p1  ORF type:complete len:381 (+),score=60.03 Phypoly_transcript_09790:154-1296(+)
MYKIAVYPFHKLFRKAKWKSLSKDERRARVVLGLCIGDSLGTTSKNEDPQDVPKNCIEKFSGWPGLLVGGGKENWAPGAPTDNSDMVLFLLKALRQDPKGKFIAANTVNAFFAFRENQKELGVTTKFALSKCTPEEPYIGAREYYAQHPELMANGSLMRNGVIPAWFSGDDQENEAIEATVLHGLITHYNPTSVVICILQTLLIRKGLSSAIPPSSHATMKDIKEIIKGTWAKWKTNTDNIDCKKWLADIGEARLLEAEENILKELKNFEKFDPYTFDYFQGSIMGSSILALKIALWALYWSFQVHAPPTPSYLPEWPFRRRGFDVIMWIVLIGADADTYGACAGPLIAAYHPHIPEELIDGLTVKPIIESFFIRPKSKL